MSRLHFIEIASPRIKLPRTSAGSVESKAILLFPTLGLGLLDFKVSYYFSLRYLLECPTSQTTERLPGVPNPTDYREIPWSAQPHALPWEFLECPTPETTVRFPGVPNPTDYRENAGSAQPPRLPWDSLEFPISQTTVRLPRVPKPFNQHSSKRCSIFERQQPAIAPSRRNHRLCRSDAIRYFI